MQRREDARERRDARGSSACHSITRRAECHASSSSSISGKRELEEWRESEKNNTTAKNSGLDSTGLWTGLEKKTEKRDGKTAQDCSFFSPFFCPSPTEPTQKGHVCWRREERARRAVKAKGETICSRDNQRRKEEKRNSRWKLEGNRTYSRTHIPVWQFDLRHVDGSVKRDQHVTELHVCMCTCVCVCVRSRAAPVVEGRGCERSQRE